MKRAIPAQERSLTDEAVEGGAKHRIGDLGSGGLQPREDVVGRIATGHPDEGPNRQKPHFFGQI